MFWNEAMYTAAQGLALAMSRVPEVDTRTRGRQTSARATTAAGLFWISNPPGWIPLTSPAKSGSFRVRATVIASETLVAGWVTRP